MRSWRSRSRRGCSGKSPSSPRWSPSTRDRPGRNQNRCSGLFHGLIRESYFLLAFYLEAGCSNNVTYLPSSIEIVDASIGFTPRSEKERARVLDISRGKIKGSQESSEHKSKKNKSCDDAFIATNSDVDSTSPK